MGAPSTGSGIRAFWQYAPVAVEGHAQVQVFAPALSTHSPTPEHAKGHLGASTRSSRTGKNEARSRTSRASSALAPGGFQTATTYASKAREAFPPPARTSSGGITTLV